MESDLGKLFIGGISWDTDEERLKDYFSNYGEVIEAVIMKDRTTGRARGFGFVVFSDPSVAERVVMEKHTIDGRMVEAKKAVPRQDQQTPTRISNTSQGSPGPTRTKKIFVGGLASTVTESDFRSYFEQFGTITDVVVMYDHNTQRPRGFGFITYDSEDAVDSVLVKTFHELNGKMVEVKRAVPKEQSPGSPMRSPIGGYPYNMSRINNLLNGYNQGFNPNPLSYGMRMDMRLGQVSNIRGRFSQYNPGFGMGMNFDQGLNPGFGSPNNNNGINFARGMNQFYNGNSPKYGNPAIYGSSNSPGPIMSSSARNTWGNGGLNHVANSISDNNNFLGSGSMMLGFGNGGINWTDSTSPGSGQSGGSGQTFGGLSHGYLSGESGFPIGGNGFGRRNRNDSSGNIGYNGSYSDLYGGSSIYGDSTWRSPSLELDDSNPFDYALNPSADVATKSTDGYIGSFNIRQ